MAREGFSNEDVADRLMGLRSNRPHVQYVTIRTNLQDLAGEVRDLGYNLADVYREHGYEVPKGLVEYLKRLKHGDEIMELLETAILDRNAVENDTLRRGGRFKCGDRDHRRGWLRTKVR